jgi:hypothetical protein
MTYCVPGSAICDRLSVKYRPALLVIVIASALIAKTAVLITGVAV